MPVTRIRSEWINGSLVFRTWPAGAEIARFNQETANFDVSGFSIDGVEVTATAAQLNSVSSQIMVRNNAGALPAGTMVAITGFDVGEDLPEVSAAGGDLPATHVLVADSVGGDNVLADEEAMVSGIDTDAIAAGDPIYLALAGGIGDAPLTGADQVSQVVGVCVVSDPATGQALFFPGYPRILSQGTSSIQNDAVTTDKIVNDAVTTDKIIDGAVTTGKLADFPLIDQGYPGKIVLNVAGVSVDAETVTIESDIYVVRTIATDTTDNTADGSFDNVTDPLTVAGAVASYSNCSFLVGDLVRLAGEYLLVTANDGTDVTFKRAVSGSTAAAHANGVDIYEHSVPAAPGAGEIFVGVATNAAAEFSTGITGDANDEDRATENFLAIRVGDAHVFFQTADEPGGTAIASDAAIAVAEATTNFEIEASDGAVAAVRNVSMQEYEVQTQEVALNDVKIVFPFAVAGFTLQCFAAGGAPRALTSQVVVAGNRISIDDDGAINPEAGNIIRVIAWS